MTNEQKEIITRLQRESKGYRTIAAEMGLPVNTVKSWCKRHPVEESPVSECRQCGAALHQTLGKRTRLYCSDRCRALWWAGHPESRGHRVAYVHICRYCGTEFTNNREKADYCCRRCFARARMKVPAHG